MTADKDQLRFFVDESALGLGKALEAARKDTIHTGHKLIPEVPIGTADELWIPAVATRDLTVIGRDKRIRTKPAELRVFRDAGLRVFRIGGKTDLSTWDWLGRVVKHWPTMEAILETEPIGPWMYVVNANGVVPVPLPSD